MRFLSRVQLLALFCLATLVGSSSAFSQGKFVVLEPTIESEALSEELQTMRGDAMLQDLADSVNALFVIPENIGLRFSECEESNAYFSVEDKEITLCAELLADMDKSLTESYPDEDDRRKAVAGAFTATALHEVGHALVSVLEIPITGREEDAVDQLSAWVLIEADMGDAVLSAAETYYTAEAEETDQETLADEHSLNQQRYFNMVCWVYGSDPDGNADLLEDWELPKARAEQCPDEYALINRSWSALLADHLQRAVSPTRRLGSSSTN